VLRTVWAMATETMTPTAMFRYPGRCYDDDGELIGVGPWSKVVGAANRLAAEAGDEPPFQLPERFPWGDDPDDSAEMYPEAWIITHLADEPADDSVEIVAMSERVSELLRLAEAEVSEAGSMPRSTRGPSSSPPVQ